MPYRAFTTCTSDWTSLAKSLYLHDILGADWLTIAFLGLRSQLEITPKLKTGREQRVTHASDSGTLQ